MRESEVRQLLQSSPSRWRTLKAAGWHMTRGELAGQAWYPGVPSKIPRRVGALPPSDRGRRASLFEHSEAWSLWVVQPDRVRAEFQARGEDIKMVGVGSTWWSWGSALGAITNLGNPQLGHGRGPGYALIALGPALQEVELEVIGATTFLGRHAIEVTAHSRHIQREAEKRQDRPIGLPELGAGADDYSLLVDAERGTLLHSEAHMNGHSFRVVSMRAVTYDDAVPDEMFSPPTDIPFALPPLKG
jgi:hypothetical protein